MNSWLGFVQSTGAYMAASRLAIATPPPAYVLSRGIGWQVNIYISSFINKRNTLKKLHNHTFFLYFQGIGVLLDGLFGTGTGSTVLV